MDKTGCIAVELSCPAHAMLSISEAADAIHVLLLMRSIQCRSALETCQIASDDVTRLFMLPYCWHIMQWYGQIVIDNHDVMMIRTPCSSVLTPFILILMAKQTQSYTMTSVTGAMPTLDMVNDCHVSLQYIAFSSPIDNVWT